MHWLLIFFILLIATSLLLESKRSDSLDDEDDSEDLDEDSEVTDNDFESINDSSLGDAMLEHRTDRSDDDSSSESDSREDIRSLMAPEVNTEFVNLPKDPEDIGNNCHEQAGSCTYSLYKDAMDHFCHGTCSKLGIDGRDVAINCKSLADLCILQYGPISENLQKYCRGTCLYQQSHISVPMSQNQTPQQGLPPGIPPMGSDQFPDLPPEVEKVLPEETVETLKLIHKDTGLTFQQKQEEIDQVLVTLPHRVLDKIPTPPSWKKLPKSVRNKLKRIMRQRTKTFARKHIELQQYIESLPSEQKAVLLGPGGMGPAAFL